MNIFPLTRNFTSQTTIYVRPHFDYCSDGMKSLQEERHKKDRAGRRSMEWQQNL